MEASNASDDLKEESSDSSDSANADAGLDARGGASEC